MKLTLSTLADAVPPESLEEYRETIQEIRAQSAWSLLVPPGDPRPKQRGDFGTLPVSWKPTFSMPAPSKPRPPLGTQAGRHPPPPPLPAPGNGAPKNAAAAAADLANGTGTPSHSASAQPPAPKLKRRKRNRQKRDTESAARRHIIACCAFAVLLIVIVFLVARNADRWHIFKIRPEPPETPLNSLPDQ
jgi:hypothetical protein